jgi:hypothetical protein
MLLEQNISECCETELKIKIKIFHQSTLTSKKKYQGTKFLLNR